MDKEVKTYQQLVLENDELQQQLTEARDTIEAIRTGQIDALVVKNEGGHQLYTLKSADQTYRMFIEKMIEGAVTLNSRGVILYSNSKFAAMVELPLSYVLGRNFIDFVEEDSQADYNVYFKKSWKKVVKGEICLVGKHETTAVQLSLTTLELDEGVALSIILTDLTLQKKAQKQLSNYNEQLQQMNVALERSNHDLQQFASVASHDLQEPLRKIQIFSTLVKEKSGLHLPPLSQEYLEKIIDSSVRMKTLIIDILNYSRLSSAINPFKTVDLNQLVNDVLLDFDLVVMEKNAVLNLGKLPTIQVNPGQMRQVFQNILSNALKFADDERQLLITIAAKRVGEKSLPAVEQADGPYCYLSITDNGIGFDEQFSKNIFSLFERLHSKDKYEGTGIGLAIAKKIIEKHNGQIYVSSKVDIGTTFIIILPVAQSLL